MELVNALLQALISILGVIWDFLVYVGKFLWNILKSVFNFIVGFFSDFHLEETAQPSLTLEGNELILLPILFVAFLLLVAGCTSIFKKNRTQKVEKDK